MLLFMRTAVLKMQNKESEGLHGKRNFDSQKDIVEIRRPGRQHGQSAMFVDWSRKNHLYICICMSVLMLDERSATTVTYHGS
jgi:hypothetical protein